MRTNSLTDEMQATVNQRLWQFVEQHGGVPTVALKLGVTKQTLYNFRDNRTFPSAGTLALIRQAYPATDINRFVSVEDLVPSPPIDGNENGLRSLVEKLSTKIEKLETAKERLEYRNDELMGQLLQITRPELFRERDGVKLPSDSLVTEPYLNDFQRSQIGFHVQVN